MSRFVFFRKHTMIRMLSWIPRCCGRWWLAVVVVVVRLRVIIRSSIPTCNLDQTPRAEPDAQKARMKQEYTKPKALNTIPHIV